MSELEGKVAVVTGAGRGIGRAVAEDLAGAGVRLALLSRTDNVLTTKEALGGGGVIAHRGDVSDAATCRRIIAEAVDEFGRVDVLVNAAAILGPTGPIDGANPDHWAETVAVNLIGTCMMMQAALSRMIDQGGGKIINFAGGGAAYGYPNFSAYAASKAAVVRATETVAEEVAAHNIQVNVIAPGANETDMLDEVRAAGGEVRTVVSIDKPLALVRFLASNRSDHVTGRFIHVNDNYEEFEPGMEESMYTLRRVEP